MRLTQTILAIGTLAFVSVASAATGTTSTTAVSVAAPTATGTDVSLVLSGAPRLVSKTSTSITLEWDKLDAAGSYIVKYGKQSVATTADAYAEESEQITATGMTLGGLTPATQYYLAVVVVDKDGMESDEYSDELAVLTDAAAATGALASAPTATGADAAQFRVTGANALNNLTFVLTFSADVGTDPVVVKVTRKSDQADIAVASAIKDSANAKNVLVNLASPLDAAAGYTIAVQSVKDAAGASIANGVNALTDLSTPDTLAAASTAPTATGADMSASGANLAAETTALPPTGTQENIIVLAALLIAGAAMYVYRRRMV